MKKDNIKQNNIKKTEVDKIVDKTFKIEFTKKEFWDLLRAIYLADWVANAICTSESKKDKGISKIRNKVLMEVSETEFEDYADFDSENNQVYPSWKLDDEPTTRALIDRYNEETFWEEIFEKLTDRDIVKHISTLDLKEQMRIAKFDFMDRIELEEPFRKHWDKELRKHGIDRLEIVEKRKVANEKGS